MLSAFFATLGVIIAVLVIIVAAIYGIVKIGLGGIGIIIGCIQNGIQKTRHKE